MSFSYVSNDFPKEYRGPEVKSPVICWPLKAGGSKWNDNELRFSFRAFCRHWKSEMPSKVFLLTDAPPKWLNHDRVTVVDAPGYVTAIVKAMELAEAISPSSHYMWWNDDIFLLKDSTIADFHCARHILGRMHPLSGLRGNGWRRKLCHIRDVVYRLGYDPVYNFSSHTPYLFHAPTMQRVIACCGVQYKTPIETAYYNMTRAWHPGYRCDDKLVFYKDKPFPADMSPYRFMSISDRGLCPRTKGFLSGRFPDKCEFEL